MGPPRRARRPFRRTDIDGSRSHQVLGPALLPHAPRRRRGSARRSFGGQVRPVYIEPAHDPGAYNREVFSTLKEFEPAFSRGGDMPMDFLAPSDPIRRCSRQGESAMKASLAKGTPHGYEVGYEAFSINGRMLGHGEPIRVKARESRAAAHSSTAAPPRFAASRCPGARSRSSRSTAIRSPRRSKCRSCGSAPQSAFPPLST